MQIYNLPNYTPLKTKVSVPNFKSNADDLNDLWEDNPNTSSLWDRMETDYLKGYTCILPPTVKTHEVWDNVNGIKNLNNVNSVKKIYTGYTLVETPDKIQVLKDKYGIKTIVDLVGYSKYKKECKEADMNYYGGFNLYYNMYSTAPFMSQEDYINKYNDKGSKEELVEKHKEETLNFNKHLNELINILDGGNVYMGCDHGHSRTNDVMLLINEYSDKKDLHLKEEKIIDIDKKKDAIKQFKANMELYSKD